MNGDELVPAVAREANAVHLDGVALTAQPLQEHLEIALLQVVAHTTLVDRDLPAWVQRLAKIGFAGLEAVEFVGLMEGHNTWY